MSASVILIAMRDARAILRAVRSMEPDATVVTTTRRAEADRERKRRHDWTTFFLAASLLGDGEALRPFLDVTREEYPGATCVLVCSRPTSELRRRAAVSGASLLWPPYLDVEIARALMRTRTPGREETIVRAITAALEERRLTFSPRQRQIILGLALGKSRSQIAADLRIAENTLKSHLRGALCVAGANDADSLVADLLRDALCAETRPPPN